MDKMKPMIQAFKKYQFWVLSGAIVLLVFGSWFVASGQMASQHEQNLKKIKGWETSMSALARAEEHPNTKYHEMMDERIKRVREIVAKAWKIKGEKQEQGQLVWPAALKRDQPEFIALAQTLRPIEEKVAYPLEKELFKPAWREAYRNYIDEELPKLAELVGAEWTATGRDEGGGTGGSFGFGAQPQTPRADDTEEASQSPPIVWDSGNQEFIRQNHFDWSSNIDGRPTTLEVLYAQEDLWVLEALMRVIRETNLIPDPKNADGPRVLPSYPGPNHPRIREINTIAIGRFVDPPTPDVQLLGEVASVGGEGGDEDLAGSSSSQATLNSGEREMEGGFDSIEAGPDPAEGRYVDMNNKPLSAEKLRAAAQSDNMEDAPLAVAKRIPVFMEVVIDEREIERLLVECGNSPLIIEVQQFRMLPRGEMSVASGGGAELISGPVRGGGGAREGTNPYLRTVQLHGIISIYNNVNLRSLGYEEEEAAAATSEEEPGDDGADASSDEATDVDTPTE
jgi:hypothetical protein